MAGKRQIKVDIGQQFGCWVVLEDLGYKGKYRCRCECGREQNIRVYDLIQGKTTMCRSCSNMMTTHNYSISNTDEYNSWMHMNQRCSNPNSKDYKNYGGRGITVYPLWQNSFEAFLVYMGPKPSPDYSIERIDVNKGYYPGNVRWATSLEQSRNKRNNVMIEINDVCKTAAEWAEDDICGVPLKTIYKRIERGWDPVEAVLAPLGENKGYFARLEQIILNEQKEQKQGE